MILPLVFWLWMDAAVAQEWEIEAERAQWKDEVWHLENLHLQVGGAWHLHAAVGEGDPAEELHLVEVSLSPCVLDHRLFSLEAAEVWLHEDVARWRGAWFVVADQALVPLPRGRAALEGARFRPGLPQVGWEEGLPRGVWPVEVRLADDTALQLAAGWWEEPLFRAGWSQEGGGIAATGTLGEAPGAGATGSISWTEETVRVGAAGLWASERGWLERHGESILDRRRPFAEQRVVLGWRDFQATSVSWQPLPGPTSWRPGLSFARPVTVIGPLQGGAMAGVDGDGFGWRTEGGVTLGASDSIGALEVEARSRALGHGWSEGGHAAMDVGGWGEARLPLWGQHGAWRHEFLFGWWGGGLERVAEAGVPRDARDFVSPGGGASGWETGPVLESQWFGPVGVRGRLLLPLQEEARFDLRLRGPGFQGGAWGTGAWTEAGAWVFLGAGVGGVESEVFWSESWVGRLSAHARLPLGLFPAVQALGVDGKLEESTASLGWSPPCQCVSMGSAVTLAADRDVPEIGLWVRAGPTHSPSPPVDAMHSARNPGGTHAILPPDPGPWPVGLH